MHAVDINLFSGTQTP